MRRVDIGSAIALIALALYILHATADYPPSPVPGSPGPAFFPRLLGGALLVLSLLLVVRSLRRPADESRLAPLDPRSLGRAALTLLLVIVFLALVERGDFFLMLPPVLAGVMWIMGERRIAVVALVPVAFAVFVYAIFYRLFGVPFPTVL